MRPLSATEIVSGNTADDGLYLPIIGRARGMIGHPGVLYSGDAKMAALATRAESIIEWEVERGLKKEEKVMKGLYAGQPQKATATPTAVALLEAISRSEITLTQLESDGQTSWHLTPLPDLLLDVLRYLHLPLTLYTGLGVKPVAENSVFDISIFGK